MEESLLQSEAYYKFIKIISDIYLGPMSLREAKYKLLEKFLDAYVDKIQSSMNNNEHSLSLKNQYTELLKSFSKKYNDSWYKTSFFYDPQYINTYFLKNISLYSQDSEFITNKYFREAIIIYYNRIYTTLL